MATILAIDDQEDNLALLEALLSSRGFVVHTALDGPTGLELAASARPDLILLDLAMPGMDGFEVLQRLRAQRLTAKTPVIVLTANYREAEMVERGLELGATEYLTKPIQMDELVVRLKSALRLSAVERELEKLRRDFASMLVHDMRAPLDGIRLALGVLRRQEEAGTSRFSLLDNAVGATEDLGQLIENLLQANRLEEEGFAAKAQPLDLAALLKRSVAAMQPLAEERGLALTAGPMAGLPRVEADPSLLRRVIDNLIGNALKFTEEGEVSVSARLEGDAVRVGVKDTGPGIPASALERIFDRYYQVARRKESLQGGLGLGLAFCEKAIRAMGGQIGVESTFGQGTEFWFSLPVEAE